MRGENSNVQDFEWLDENTLASISDLGIRIWDIDNYGVCTQIIYCNHVKRVWSSGNMRDHSWRLFIRTTNDQFKIIAPQAPHFLTELLFTQANTRHKSMQTLQGWSQNGTFFVEVPVLSSSFMLFDAASGVSYKIPRNNNSTESFAKSITFSKDDKYFAFEIYKLNGTLEVWSTESRSIVLEGGLICSPFMFGHGGLIFAGNKMRTHFLCYDLNARTVLQEFKDMNSSPSLPTLTLQPNPEAPNLGPSPKEKTLTLPLFCHADADMLLLVYKTPQSSTFSVDAYQILNDENGSFFIVMKAKGIIIHSQTKRPRVVCHKSSFVFQCGNNAHSLRLFVGKYSLKAVTYCVDFGLKKKTTLCFESDPDIIGMNDKWLVVRCPDTTITVWSISGDNVFLWHEVNEGKNIDYVKLAPDGETIIIAIYPNKIVVVDILSRSAVMV